MDNLPLLGTLAAVLGAMDYTLSVVSLLAGLGGGNAEFRLRQIRPFEHAQEGTGLARKPLVRGTVQRLFRPFGVPGEESRVGFKSQHFDAEGIQDLGREEQIPPDHRRIPLRRPGAPGWRPPVPAVRPPVPPSRQ